MKIPARFLVPLFLLALCSTFATAQPALREGWPQDFSSASFNPFTVLNPLSVVEAGDGNRYIAAGTCTHIRLYDIEGTLLQTWATNDLVPEEPNADFLAGGPLLTDVDGDGDLEVVAVLRRNTGSTRALAVLEFDGSLNTTLSRGYTLSAVDISSLACADLDGDGFDEIVYTTTDEIHAIDQDGSELEGFPWNVDRTHVGAGPVIVPAEVNGGTAVIVWVSYTVQLHAREVDSDSDLPGFPVSFSGPAGYQVAPPMIIPTGESWLIAFASSSGVYVWDAEGEVLDGFPVVPAGVDPNLMMYSGMADMNGNGSPDIVFRSWNSDAIHAVDLAGDYLTGFPYSTGTEAGRSESISMFKPSPDEAAWHFYGSLGPGSNQNGLHGRQGTTPLPGFPVNLNLVELNSTMLSAVFKPVDGNVSIVIHTLMGYTSVYDLPLEVDPAGTVEWGMPFAHANGNRLYQPMPFVGYDGPIFTFTPATFNYGEVEVGTSEQSQIVVRNTGTQSGTIHTAQWAENDPADELELTANLPATLAPGESIEWLITWTPGAEGELTDTLLISHDEAFNGTESQIIVQGSGVTYPQLVFPEVVDFGVIYTDDPHGWAELVVENQGEGEGVIGSIIVPTAHAHLLAVEEELPIFIEAGGTASITLHWTPTFAVPFTSSLTILHNDPAQWPEVSVEVTGEMVNSLGEAGLPHEYALSQNHPNPFNPETSISFSLREPGMTSLKVFSVDGREVMTLVHGQRDAGRHQILFNGNHLASGVYFYRLEVNGFHAMRKMVLVR